MMLFDMQDIVYRPMYPLRTMIIIASVLVVVVLLNRRHIINRLLIIALLVIISQRPMLKNQEEATYSLNIDVLFVIDNTVSMNAVDAEGGTRLEAVKRDCKEIMNLLKGANFAVVSYSNVSLIKHPFTSDTGDIKDILDQMKVIDPVYANGSTLDMPHDSMKILLSSSSKKEKHYRVVFFMGDGELIGKEVKETNLSNYNDLKEMINDGAVLGYGTTAGGKVKITESSALNKVTDSSGFLLDGTSGGLSISKLNETNLKQLATALSIDYSHMPDESFLEKKVEEIKKGSEEDEDGKENLDKDIYYYFSGGLIVLLLLELFHYRRDER